MMRRVLVDAARARQAAKRGVEGLSLEAEDVRHLHPAWTSSP